MRDAITLRHIQWELNKKALKKKLNEDMEELAKNESGNILEYLAEHWIAAVSVAAALILISALIALAGEKITAKVTEVFS